ncbi:23S rRNA (adenine(2030)-N(6))-methyltransferase RlmJ [Elioraea sp. Yellowstone]|jgi:23S rRNA (adenine2030-N6)-methyltransferase|uniref:23S rRNA (adenine(2030)-N(6))-methyltransferase RlmJ n=1 Tax=Elioraea sp. Yellowstone TaxID=2592070 RepID=UPI00114E2672|nr:23S rRNA (adenine(2030)-N(6))-methyltransferase RlmJ [Elioraea sp. Yellowstone]TQF76911.1 23S rRNA (adenine(2030)-N(6))-methyltransferase RlmJ [Elioraea sp. Yellowstone]
MNYRHAFHAGNHGDCLKHALLVALIEALRRKDAPFAVADLHAGRGRYDLAGEEAARTGEWRSGIGRLLGDPPPALADYVALVRRLGLYPGSPAIARALLRPQDRLMLNEKHPEEYAALAAWADGDRRITLRCGDAYALRGVVPPAGLRRGLILFDPPYESPDEHDRVAAALHAAHRAAPTFMLAVWYPVKHLAPVRALRDALRGLPKRVDAALHLRPPFDPARLNGSGLLVVNAPWRYDEQARAILEALALRLAEDPGAGIHLEAGHD